MLHSVFEASTEENEETVLITLSSLSLAKILAFNNIYIIQNRVGSRETGNSILEYQIRTFFSTGKGMFFHNTAIDLPQARCSGGRGRCISVRNIVVMYAKESDESLNFIIFSIVIIAKCQFY